MSIRTEKAGKEVQRALSEIMLSYAGPFHAGLITITTVRMSSDLRIANAYLSIFGGTNAPKDVLAGLNNVKSEIRYQLGQKVQMRFVPEVRLFLDDTLEEINHIQDLVKKAEDDIQPIDEIALSNSKKRRR